MGFYLNGYVLRPARVAPANSPSTSEATSGVSHDHILPQDYGYHTSPTAPIDVCGLMYQAAVLNRPVPSTDEYCLWAATTGSLSTPPGAADFLVDGGSSSVLPVGAGLIVTRVVFLNGLPRSTEFTGTDTLLVQDPNGRDIKNVTTISFRIAGIIPVDVTLSGGGVGFTFDAASGYATLTAAGIALLAGGFSEAGGDSVVSAWYALSPPTFWWSRNDTTCLRFGWDGESQRWAPYQGGPPQSLGVLKPDTSFTLSPKPTRFVATGTTYLPGDPSTPDGYALLRVGLAADSSAIPILTLVVLDSEAVVPYTFVGALPDAVVGQTNGILQFNPNTGGILEERTGLPVWYNPETFIPTMDGDLGRLDEAATSTIILSPIPGPTDRPFLRYGWRKHLNPVPYSSDATLPTAVSLPAGSFAWSMTTGKVVLSEADMDRATPGSSTSNVPPDAADYELSYLGARVYYDGVSMTQQPVPVRTPVPLQNASGDSVSGTTLTIPANAALFVPRAVPLPFPGVSGVEMVPDGSGTVPNTATPETRPNGSGLVRSLSGVGDSFVFAASIEREPTYAFANLDVQEYEEDLNKLLFRIPNTDAQVARMEASSGPAESSLVKFRRRGITDSGGYFAQSSVMPCTYAEPETDTLGRVFARIWSRSVEPFVLTGSEKLPLYFGADLVDWDSTVLGAGSYTAVEIAASLEAICFAAGLTDVSITNFRGRVSLGIPFNTIEVAWNADTSDVSGHAALGFLPGWKTSTASAELNWLPDNGMSFGLFRSPENVNAKETTPDIASVAVINAVLTENIPAVPFLNLSIFPLEDVPGYAKDVHFRVVQGLSTINLKNYDGLYYDFANDRVSWAGVAEVSSTAIQNPTSTLQLGASLALPDTVSSAAMAPLGLGFGLYLREATDVATTELALGDDFLLPGGGGPGQAMLTTLVSPLEVQGAAGECTTGGDLFQDQWAANVGGWETVEPGYLLRVLNGDSAGVYTITEVSGDPATPVSGQYIRVSPPFPEGAGPTVSEPYAQWRVYEGFPDSVYNPGLVADVQQDLFNHFAVEPFVIRTLSLMGTVGATTPLPADAATALERGRIIKVRFTPQTDATYVEAEQVSITLLERAVSMGAFKETGMSIPVLTDSHFTPSSSDTTPYFQIRVGANTYSAANGNLSLVSVFSLLIPGDVLEVGRSGSMVVGQIRAGNRVEGAGQSVYYDQIPLVSSLIPAGTCEMVPNTGEITLNSLDDSAHAGKRAYFVEQMITEKRLDVTSAPLTGSLMFNDPLRAGQLVEVDYYQADDSGDKALDADGNAIQITEYLPLIVRLEEATRVDATTYTFNPTGKTYSDKIEPFVWVGVELQNYGGLVTCVVDGVANEIRFAALLEPTDVVKINYGVLEAFGGEQAYSVSTPPVYRKPFFLEVAQDTFVLDTDRTSDFVVGALMLIGPAPFYVKSRAYNATADTTTVTIWPPPLTEVGSRAPGGDVVTSLSAVPVAITIDPEGTATPGGGAAGFLMEFPEAMFLPVDVGALKISFYGDYRQFAQPQHLIEIGGYPFICGGSQLSADGRYTVTTLSTPSPQGFSWDADPARSDAIRISVRPVYLPNARVFQSGSPFLNTEEYEAYILGGLDSAGNELPGTVLTAGVHFQADPSNGQIVFLSPTQPSLVGGERLLFRHTRVDSVAPVIVDGAQYNPVYKAKNLSILTPSIENGLQGSILTARFTYSNPDTFYCRVTPLVDYMPEVAGAALAKVVSSAPSGGPALAFPGAPINYKKGSLGLRGTVRNLDNLDQGGRSYLALYNAIIVAWEQVLETIDGRIIGDRDGKFRLFVGHGKSYAPPGYEDIYTGGLNQRNLWRLLVEEWSDEAGLAEGYVREKDGIYGPTTYVLDTHGGDTPGDVDGRAKSGAEIETYIEFQRNRVKNDIDDRVLTGLEQGAFLAQLFPWLEVNGKYEDMWEPHQLSRIYPERTLAFTRLFPGLTAENGVSEGFYSAGRVIEVPGPEPGEISESRVSTRNTMIGSVSNPVFEAGVPNISDINVRDRFPRARIWAYYPEGSAELDAAMTATGLAFTPTVGLATFVVTPLPFSEFPLDQTTGFPDVVQLISNGGALADASSGDFALATPGFEANKHQLRWGKPTGVTGTLYGPEGSAGWGSQHTNVYVDAVQLGCVITVNDGEQPTPVVLSNTDVNSVGMSAGFITYTAFTAEQGDTLWCGPVGNASALSDVDTDEPTTEDLAVSALALEDYRVQFDIGVNHRKGTFVDKSLSKGWSNDEAFPFNLQGLFGQAPPSPLSAIEADVSFTNTGQPVQIPALKGEAKNDSGDVSIPYMSSTNTELAILGEAAASISMVFDSDTSVALPVPAAVLDLMANEYQYWKATYPTEFPDAGTRVATAVDAGTDTNPNVLYTQQEMQPVTAVLPYTDRSSIGSIRPFDLLFVEAGQPLVGTGALLPALTGILSVGDVRSDGPIPTDYASALETPRFVSPTTKGVLHNYTAYNVFAGNTSDGALGPGVFLSELVGLNIETYIDLSSVAALALDDGFAGGNGGLWNVLLGGGNAVRIDFYSPDLAHVGDPLLATLVLSDPSIANFVWATNHVLGGPATLHTLVSALQIVVGASGGPQGNMFSLETSAGSGSVMLALGLTNGVPYDFTISVDTYITSETSAATNGGLPAGGGLGSVTAHIPRDRLTFSERFSFADALNRDALPQNGDTTNSMGLMLNVWASPMYTGATQVASDVNACAYQTAAGGINGGTWADPIFLTFKNRVGPSPDVSVPAGVEYVGTYIDATADGAADEEGLIRAMAFEYENVSTNFLAFPGGNPVDSIRISVASSSDVEEADEILEMVPAIFPDSGEVLLQTAGLPFPASTDVWSPRTWVQQQSVAVAEGSVSNVLPGDIALISGGAAPATFGSVKSGTYLVRHAVQGDATAPTYGDIVSTAAVQATAGSKGWLDLRFPIIEAIDSTAGTIKLKNVAGYLNHTSTGLLPCTNTSGYLFVILKTQYATYNSSLGAGSRYTLVDDSVYRIDFSNGVYDSATETLTADLDDTSVVDAAGAGVTDLLFWAAATVGRQVSSNFVRFNVLSENLKAGYPTNNLVGYWEDSLANPAVAGFSQVNAGNNIILDITGGDPIPVGEAFWKWEPVAFAGTAGAMLYKSPFNISFFPNLEDNLGVVCHNPKPSTAFYEIERTPIYAVDDGQRTAGYGPPSAYQAQGVAQYLVMQNGVAPAGGAATAAETAWNRIHFTEAEVQDAAFSVANVLQCLLPGDVFVAGDDVDVSAAAAGHTAVAGVFFEPSIPYSTITDTSPKPRVVSASYTAGASAEETRFGSRRWMDHGGTDEWADTFVLIRRIRRFHEVNSTVSAVLEPLKYVYETRRGLVDVGTPPVQGQNTFTANLNPTATTIGNFTDQPNINIHSGDVLRLLDADGNVVDTAEIRRVYGAAHLLLRTPGWTAANAVLLTAVTFEIYLEQAPVPHEQSHDQLLDLLTDTVVRKVGVDYPAGVVAGAYVDEFNKIKDDTLTGSWEDEGVQKGDYIVVDPAGVLYITKEQGARAVGDVSTIARVGGHYAAGPASELDDNRGFYKVSEVATDHLVVAGASRFCGGSEDGSDDVVFGTVGTSDYVLLPSVHASTLVGWTGLAGTDPPRGSQEGQQSLRPTAAAVDDGTGQLSYKARTTGDYALYKSLGPFGYRIIRPSQVFSTDAAELVLFQRGRFLSWMEEIKLSYDKGGTYYIFQKDDHIKELPSATDPTAGLGVFTNTYLKSLAGETDGAPFENTSDCVSILDRRFWVLDYRLDSEFNSVGEPYTAFVTNAENQRPVLVDYIEGALDTGDQFREQRFSWVMFRADRQDGSIVTARREAEGLPRKIRKQRELALQRKALEGS